MEPMLTLMLVLVFKESAILYEDTKKILFGYFKVFYQVVSASLEHSISSYTIAAPGPRPLTYPHHPREFCHSRSSDCRLQPLHLSCAKSCPLRQR